MAKTKSSGKLHYLYIVILYILPLSHTQDEDTCIFPGIQANGKTEPFKASFAIGDIVTFSCFENYAIVGQANLTCQGANIWDAEIPVCVKVCPEITFPDTQVISQNVTLENVNVIGDVLVWGCKDGYSIDPGQQDDQTVIVCKPEGWFTQSVITCSKISCPDPGIPIGVDRDGDSFEFEDVVTFSCSNNYEVISNGSSSRTCQSDGTWSGSNPTCTAIDCMDPGTNDLTTRTGDAFSYAAVVLYECVNDAIQVSGSVSIECQLDGTWSGEPLICQYPTTHVRTTIMQTTSSRVDRPTFSTSVLPSTIATPEASSLPNSLPARTTGPQSASTRIASMPNTKEPDEEKLSLQKGIIYVIGLIVGSLVFVFLIGSGICIFTSDSRRRRRSNAVQKTDWVLTSDKDAEAEAEPVYEAPPEGVSSNKYLKPHNDPDSKLINKNDSVRSEASYLTPDDITSHDYQNIPEVLTRL